MTPDIRSMSAALQLPCVKKSRSLRKHVGLMLSVFGPMLLSQKSITAAEQVWGPWPAHRHGCRVNLVSSGLCCSKGSFLNDWFQTSDNLGWQIRHSMYLKWKPSLVVGGLLRSAEGFRGYLMHGLNSTARRTTTRSLFDSWSNKYYPFFIALTCKVDNLPLIVLNSAQETLSTCWQ